MILKLRQRMAQEESGFTLVELLVVMLILGLLAAIAIPAFFNQRDKARDAQAKVFDRTAETAMETYATDNGGTYNGATRAALVAEESTLTGASFADSELEPRGFAPPPRGEFASYARALAFLRSPSSAVVVTPLGPVGGTYVHM